MKNTTTAHAQETMRQNHASKYVYPLEKEDDDDDGKTTQATINVFVQREVNINGRHEEKIRKLKIIIIHCWSRRIPGE